jgi:hypothetical protein
MSSSPQKEEKEPLKWASLADRLNPNRAAFDPKFKEEWQKMDKVTRKKLVAEDKQKIRELQQRAKPLPFTTDANDHCETSKTAYGHIVPFLKFLAKKMEKEPSDLKIYDPYYCAGAVVQHLTELGFPNVHNQPDDFYKTISNDKIPEHDVVVTNPPYSGDHFARLKEFLASNQKPHCLLIPDHFQVQTSDYAFLKPKERYHYWTPRGMRPEEGSKKRKHRNLMLGSRNSPFPSKWCISLEPNISKADLLETMAKELAEGCAIHGTDDNFSKEGAKFRQKDLSHEDAEDRVCSQKKKRKKKNNK